MEYEYQVCLSFAGEQREYVQEVYDSLKERNIKAFYDKEFETELWGSNLIEVFHNIYKKNAKYCVMFISKEYKEKAWTHFERISALERQIYANEAYILPVRFDNTELPGLSEGVLYLNANELTPQEIADRIINKLGIEVSSEMSEFDLKEYINKVYKKIKIILEEANYKQDIEIRNSKIIIFSLRDEKEYCHLMLEISGVNKLIVTNIDFFHLSFTEKTVTEKELYDLINDNIRNI